jgi:hypothetical protein
VLSPPTVEDRDGLLIVRDDLLPGGTKVRFLADLFRSWPEHEFVYAGPTQGYAQVAMGHAAALTGKQATCFIAQRAHLHPRSAAARQAGARLVEVPHGRLSVVRARARAYAELVGARFLPLGFDLPEARDALAEVASGLGLAPPEVWCVAGSGLLSRALQQAWPAAAHVAVRIGQPPDVGAARLLRAPEAFAQDARERPPFPACSNYDAKAWRFVRAEARPGALFWNAAA